MYQHRTKDDYSSVLLCKTLPAIPNELWGVLLFVISNADIMAGYAEGTPGDVHPAVAGQELVGVGICYQEIDQALELSRVLRANVGSLAKEVLRPADTANQGVDARVAEAGVDEDGTADGLAGGLQQVPTAVHKAGHLLDRRNVSRVLAEVAELCQRKVWGQTDVVHHTAAPMHAVVVNAVRAAVAAATIILRRTSQMLFFFIIVVFFKMLINRVNCVCFIVLDYLLNTLQRYEKFLNYPNF